MKSLHFFITGILVFFLHNTMMQAQKQEQILGTSTGKYCMVSIEKHPQKENIFSLSITVNWIDEYLEPIMDTSSLLIITEDNIVSPDKESLTCISLEEKDMISFNKSATLEFSIDEAITKNTFEVNLLFQYASDLKASVNKNKREDFFLKRPHNLAIAYDINLNLLTKKENTPPAITLVSPTINNQTQKALSESIDLEISIKAFDESGINLVMINSKDATLAEDGYYKSKLKLKPGDNIVSVMATDNDGSISEEKIIIYCDDYSQAAETLLKGGKFYALIIAVENYEDKNINNLDHAIEDAHQLKNILSNYYSFDEDNIEMLTDPAREDMVIALDKLSNKVTEKDNLLIFYAGHGHWEEKSSIGYWLPSDAKQSNTANWFRNSTLRDYISSINSSHTLLIADACFSGAIFKTRSAFVNTTVAIEKLYNLPSRKAMTSGTLEEVPDRSVFVEYLIKRLEENPEIYLSSEVLFSSLKTAVINNSSNIPQFGEISNTGDEGGDFIFIRKKGIPTE